MEKKSKNKTQVLAYSRRQKENDTFSDIASALPIQENAKDLDKASILRLAINYLKLRDMIKDGNEEENDTELQAEGPDSTDVPRENGLDKIPDALIPTKESLPSIAEFLPNFSKDVIQALDGFIMVISRDGRILFSSESIANYLGLRQVDVIGQKVQDIVHPQDCSEVLRIFQSQGHDKEQVFDEKDPLRRKFVLRMRCAFTPSVRSISRCSNFKPIFCSCYLKFGRSGPSKGQFLGIVVFCKLATVSKIKEMVVGTFFKTKHSLDLSYTFVDTRIRWILGYDPTEMTGLKAYQYFHPQDLGVTSSCHMNLLSNGISNSPCYRFLTRWGDWVWCRSKSEMLFNKKSQLPEGIVIYTWIVRVAEEDDRMLAIKNGEDGEDKKKTYDKAFASTISSGTGSLDIAALANPNSEPSLPQDNLSPTKSTRKTSLESKLSECSAPSPPQSAESSPSLSQFSGGQRSVDQGYQTSMASSPPMGLGMVGGVYSPPSSVVYSHSPGSAGSPNSNVMEYPPNMVPLPSDQAHVHNTSQAVDQTLTQSPPFQPSFALSPPYTPYSLDQTPPTCFSNSAGIVEENVPVGPEMNSSQFADDFMGMPNSFNTQDIFSPEMSMPIFDQMPPVSGYNMPPQTSIQTSPPFSQSENIFASPQSMNTHPPMIPTNQILSMSGHVTHYSNQSSILSPPMEPQFVSITANSSRMETPSGYFPGSDRAFGDSGSQQVHMHQSTGVQIKQNVIAETRARYGGLAPSTHLPMGGGGVHREMKPMRGQNPRLIMEQNSNEDLSSRTSPQWSQWVKNGAPEPVC